MGKPITRRHFMKSSCIIAAAAGITLCGGGALAATYRPNIELPASTYKGSEPMKNILLAYATKAGSTAEIAQRVGKTLSSRGYTVDVKPVSEAGDLSGYQGVILGSAIRVGSVLPEVKAFIEKNQAGLTQIPFNLFIVCMTLEKDTEENRKAVSAYLDPVRVIAKPASEGLFAGVMDPKKLPLIERLMIKAMKAPLGDFRRWDQIEAWTETLALPA